MDDFADEIDGFRAQLDAAGLGKHAQALVAMAQPSVRLQPDPTGSRAHRTTRLGGTPDLPVGASWPRTKNLPMSLVAQVNLAEVAPFESEGLLPRDGLLSFFYDAVGQGAWGFDPADRGSAAVIYTPASVATESLEPPADLSSDGRFDPVALRPSTELTFAPWESYDVETLGMSREEEFAYAEVLDDEVDHDEGTHRLLGHPEPVQGDMQVECQLVTNGLYCGSSEGYEDPRAARLRSGASEWRLLLQIDSQDGAKMMWGDMGRLYYWMRISDLRSRKWAASWLILQCG